MKLRQELASFFCRQNQRKSGREMLSNKKRKRKTNWPWTGLEPRLRRPEKAVTIWERTQGHGNPFFFDEWFPQDDDVTGEITERSPVTPSMYTRLGKTCVSRGQTVQRFGSKPFERRFNPSNCVLSRPVQAFVSSLGADVPMRHTSHRK